MTKKCEICGSSSQIVFKDGKVNILKCNNCGLYFLNGKSFDNKNSSQVNWDARKESLKSLRYNNYKKILSKLNKLNPIDNMIGLEVGCAYGWFLELANKKGKCIGIEPDFDNIKINNQYTIYHGFFPDDLPKQIENLDYIIFNDVFEHIPKCTEVMQSCNNLLKKDGYLIVNLPLSTGFFYKLATFLNLFGKKINSNYERLWQLKTNSPHLYYFNSKNLINLAEMKGFEFVCSGKLDTLDINNIKDRITSIRSEKYVKLKADIIKLFYPIIRTMPCDVGYIIFRKC